MKKYILTNDAGETGTGVKLKVGKFVHDGAQHAALLARLTSSAESPALAALISPIVPVNVRLFQVHSWNVTVGDPNKAQNYTVVKEISPVPRVTLEMRMTFALLALKGVVTNREFRVWAENWIANKERGAISASALRKVLEGEHQASEGLDELAAWGAASGDDLKTVHKIDELERRALDLVEAAELAEGGSANAEAMGAAIARALNNISRDAGRVDLQALATLVFGPETALDSGMDEQTAAS